MNRFRYTALALALVATALILARPRLFGVHNGPVDLDAIDPVQIPHFASSYSPHASGEDALAREAYELNRLRDPATGAIPRNVRARDLAFVANLPHADDRLGKAGASGVDEWRFRGPLNVGGRTRALAIDLDFNGSSNRRVLAGGVSGGMYLSEDDGISWLLTTSLDDHASVTSIVQDPSSRNVWYHGTGEGTGNSASGGGGAIFNGTGIFKSTNGGQSWTLLSATFPGSIHEFDTVYDRVWNLAVHPTNGAVYAALYGQIVRSVDGGSNWTVVLGSGPPYSSVTDVLVTSDGDVYAAMSRNGSGKAEYGIYKSATGDPGSFVNISPPGLATDPFRMVLSAATGFPESVYLLVQANANGDVAADHQLFRYNDGSTNWTDLSAGLPNEAGVESNGSMSTQGGYDQLVRAHPSLPNTIFIGGVNLYRSDNGGASFTRIGGYATAQNYAQYAGHHSDQHSLVFYPNDDDRALSGHDGGVSQTQDIRAANVTWSMKNTGYVTSQFYGVGLDPNAGGEYLIGGLQDNGTWAIGADLSLPNWVFVFSGDGGFSHVAPGGLTLYMSSQLGELYRLAGGTVYSNIAPAGGSDYQFIVSSVLDPNDARVMYVAEAGGVWRNSNLDGIPAGNTDPTNVNWTFLSGSAQSGEQETTTVAASVTPANRIYFGTTNFQDEARVIRVDDAAGNGAGVNVMPPIATGGFPAYPSHFAINPDDGDEIVAVFSNYGIESIWHTTDAGETWTNVGGNLGGENGPSIRTAAFVTTDTGPFILVGTSVGVYSSGNLAGSNTTWSLESGDVIGNVVVNQIVARRSDNTVVVATHGRGVYQARVTSGGGSTQAQTNVTSLTINVPPGSVGMTTFELSNTGTSDLSYSVAASAGAATRIALKPHTPTEKETSDRLRIQRRAASSSRDEIEATQAAQPDVPTSTTAVQDPSPASSTHNATRDLAAKAATPGDILILDDGGDTPDQFIGWGDGVTPFQWYNSFTAPAGGFTLESVYVYMKSDEFDPHDLEVSITDPVGNAYVSGTISLPGSSSGAWYQITFDPVALGEGDVFEVEFVAISDIEFPAGADFNAQITGNSFYLAGASYQPISSIGGFESGAFLIRAQGTAGAPSRLTATPSSGTIPASQSETITVSYDAVGQTEGAYNGAVNITSNGGDISLPVSINVFPVGTEETAAGGEAQLLPNYPNPFTAETQVPFRLEQPAHVRITVFDVEGRVVRRLLESTEPAGDHTVTWNTESGASGRVASGTYFVRMETVGQDGNSVFVGTRKLTVQK